MDPNHDSLTEDELLAQGIEEDFSELAELPGVDVSLEKLDGRKRRITATVQIPAGVDPIWTTLTEYEQLPDFIPNLIESTLLGEEDGCKLVKQVGQQNLLFMKFAAAVTLKIQEVYPHQLVFTMAQGDFKEFYGSWEIAAGSEGSATTLTYTLTILPPRHMPLNLIERRLRRDMAVNLSAIRDQACRSSSGVSIQPG